MAQIDKLIEKMQQNDVRRMVLTSGQPIELHSGKGRLTGAVLNEAILQNLLQEITPSHLQSQLAMKEDVDFQYAPPSGPSVYVTVFNDRGVLRAVVATTKNRTANEIGAEFQLNGATPPAANPIARSGPTPIQQVTANEFVKEVWDSPKPVAVIFYDVGAPQPNWEIFNRMADYFEGGLKFVRCPFDTGDDRYYRYVDVGGGRYATLALAIFQGEQVIYKPASGSVDALDWMMEIEKVLVSRGVSFANQFSGQQKTASSQIAANPRMTPSQSNASDMVPVPSIARAAPLQNAAVKPPNLTTSFAPVSAPPAVPQSQDEGWHYATGDNKRLGPVTYDTLKRLVASGTLKRESLVWREGMYDWTAAHLTELSDLFPRQSSPPPLPLTANDSGLEHAVLPAELRGYNWGAFFLGVLWSIAHSTWIGLAGIAIYVLVLLSSDSGTAYFSTMLFWGWLGFKGNEFAWRNRTWDTIQEFKNTQRTWAQWGLVFFAITFVLGFVGAQMTQLNRDQTYNQAIVDGDYDKALNMSRERE